MSHATEHELLARIRRGDQAALGQLLADYQRRLYNVCLRMVSNRDDAAEVTQDALLKIVQHIDGFRGEAGLSTWMIRIAMNQSISHLRRRRLRQTASLDHAAGNGHAGRAGSSGGDDQATALRHQIADTREPAPDHRVQQEEQHRQLHAALGRLEEEFRAVIVLRDLEQMDYQQIADTLELPVGTVKSRLFRARLALRQQLQAPESSPRDALRDPSSPRPEVSDG